MTKEISLRRMSEGFRIKAPRVKPQYYLLRSLGNAESGALRLPPDYVWRASLGFSSSLSQSENKLMATTRRIRVAPGNRVNHHMPA